MDGFGKLKWHIEEFTFVPDCMPNTLVLPTAACSTKHWQRFLKIVRCVGRITNAT